METTIADRFNQFIGEQHLCPPGARILLTVSGGSDSMTLADLFCQRGDDIGVAHVNFQLRGADSTRDEAFVKSFCEARNIPFFVTRFDTKAFAGTARISIQEAARVLRYDWFEKIRVENGYALIATAHHLNDHIETLLINFFKGSGIHGLHGIPLKNGKIIRPMLFITKKEISEYVRTRDIKYVEDRSNASDKYTRNFLRHRVIPLLEEPFPGIEKRLEQNIHRFLEAGELYDQAIARHQKKLVETRGVEHFVPILKLKKTRPLASVAYELFRTWNFSFEQSLQIIAMLDSTPGKTISSSTHRLIRDRTWLIISPLETAAVTHRVIGPDQRLVPLPGASLHLKLLPAVDHHLSGDPGIASVDGDRITYPLMLRKWKQGDYFYPLGLGKKKKISRFLIDRKIPLHEKEKIWVLESEGRILWVAGLRIDDRFKITPATATVLRLEWKKKETGEK